MSRGTLLYNPAEASTEELEALFVGREALLDVLLKELAAQHTGPTVQHFLVVGPRGSGKTHLTELLARRLAASEEAAWRTVRLPEEGYALGGLQDLAARIADLDAGTTSDWDAPVPPVEESVAALGRRREETGRPLLVVLENLPRLLGRVLQGEQEVARLRSILMNDPPCTLVATATSYFEDVAREDRPLYDFFRVLTLDDLTAEQVEELVTRRAEWDGQPAVLREVDALQRRVRAIHHLSGGNPRLGLALYEILKDGVSRDILDQFIRLLDQVTPCYQARLDDLSPQQALVLTRLSLAPGPLAPAELGRQVGRSTSHTTAVLKVLRAERFVRRVPGGGKRRSLHAVTDRLFRIWLEMREGRGARRRMRFLVDFYRRAYTPEELRGVLRSMCGQFGGTVANAETRCCRDGALAIEYVAEAMGELEDGEGHVLHLFLDEATKVSNPEHAEAIQAHAERLAPDHPEVAAGMLTLVGSELDDVDRLSEAEAVLRRAQALWPTFAAPALRLWGVLFQMGRYGQALGVLGPPGEDDGPRRFARAVARLYLGEEEANDELSLAVAEEDCGDCLAARLRGVFIRTPEEPTACSSARDLVTIVLDEAPDCAPVHVAVAWWEAGCGRMAEATSYADRAERIGPSTDAWEWLACTRAQVHDVFGFARAAGHALEAGREGSRRHVLSDVAVSLTAAQDPAAHRLILAPLFDALRGPDADDVEAAYGGLWHACSDADPAWTAGCVTLLDELVGEAPEPWATFRRHVERERDPAVLPEVHPEVREAVELLLERHSVEVEAPPMMADAR